MAGDRSITCGLFGWRPKFLQPLANQVTFLAIFSVISIIQASSFSYASVVLSNIEKEFRLESQQVAWIYSGNEISNICISILVPLVIRTKRKTLVVSLSMCISAIGLFILATPHILIHNKTSTLSFGGLEANKSVTDSPNLCSDRKKDSVQDSCQEVDSPNSEKNDFAVMALMFVGMFMVGIGGTMIWVLGLPYGDDNTQKESGPFAIGVVWASRLAGPGLGYILGSLCLKVYVNPWVTEQAEEDHNYIGAWWLGFPIIGVTLLLFSPFLALFPGRLPSSESGDTDASKIAEEQNKQGTDSTSMGQKFKETYVSFWRIVRNKIYFFNMMSIVFFLFGFLGFATFLPKYLEVQFQKKASEAGLLGGLAKTISGAIGTLVAGYVIGRFKINSRKLAAWNVICGTFIACSFVSFIFLECDQAELMAGCGSNSECHCQENNFQLVCNPTGSHIYPSPCAAGCSVTANNTFLDCKCLSNHSLEPRIDIRTGVENEESRASKAFCQKPCHTHYYFAVLGVLFFISLLFCSQRPGNALFMLRCIDPTDKIASLTFLTCITSILCFLPSPIIYGRLIDSTCILWNNKCGQEGNCLFYDVKKMRIILNGFTSFFIGLGTLCDLIVFFLCKELDVYDQKKANVKIERSIGKNSRAYELE